MKPSAFFVVAALLSVASLVAIVIATAPTYAGQSQSVDNAETVPSDAKALFEFLKARKYVEFAAQESERHPSAGPHTRVENDVRVFMNSTLDQSLKIGAEQHPNGAGVVKEMFAKDGKLRGWAVAVKTDADSKDGQGWFWYEVKSTTDDSRPVAAANGVALCAGCHVAGQDFVLSQYPLQ